MGLQSLIPLQQLGVLEILTLILAEKNISCFLQGKMFYTVN